MKPGSGRARLLLIAFYFAAVGGHGGWVPFLGLYLERGGHTGASIGALLALMPLARMVSAPIWAGVADRFREGALLLRICSLGSVLLGAAALLPVGDLGLGILLLLFAATRAPIGPIMDAHAVDVLVESGADAGEYGRIRLWGSLGFLLVALVGSLLVDAEVTAPLVLALAIWFASGLLAFGLGRARAGGPAPLGPALRLLARQPFFSPFLLALAFHGTALATYDCLITVHLSSLGLPSAWSGACIAAGILVEVAVMAVGPALLARVGPLRLVAIALSVGAVRWALTGLVREPALLVAIQGLHGISFGAFWIGAVELMRRRAPPEIGASAQALLTNSAYGVGALGSAALAAVFLDRIGTSGLFLMGGGLGLCATLLVLFAARRERLAAA